MPIRTLTGRVEEPPGIGDRGEKEPERQAWPRSPVKEERDLWKEFSFCSLRSSLSFLSMNAVRGNRK